MTTQNRRGLAALAPHDVGTMHRHAVGHISIERKTNRRARRLPPAPSTQVVRIDDRPVVGRLNTRALAAACFQRRVDPGGPVKD
jgi:hypothetical protein